VTEQLPGAGLAWRWITRPWLMAAVVGLVWAGSGLFVVDKMEHGVVTVFGAVTRDRVPPGLHYAPPWPAGRVAKVDTSTNHTMSVGFKLRDMVLGIPTPAAESRWLTGDTNIVEVRMVVQYRATDPTAYLYAADDPDGLVRHAGEAAVTDLLGHREVDELLTHGRIQLIADGKLAIQRQLDDWGAGITVTAVNFESIDPPREVVDAFHDVQSAEANSKRMRQEAEAYANTILPEARGEAARLLSEARSHKEARVAEATGWGRSFEQLVEAQRLAPRETRTRLYLETVETALARTTNTVLSPKQAGEQLKTVVVLPTTPDQE